VAESLTDSFKGLLDRLGEFFGLFDLSFFVSGTAMFGSIYIWLYKRGYSLDFNDIGLFLSILLIVSCYVIGLVMFACGRRARNIVTAWWRLLFQAKEYRKRKDRSRKINDYKFDEGLVKVINAHGLDVNKLLRDYLARETNRGTWRLYIKLWSILRQNKKYMVSLSFLNRYWVMAATYDGLGMALVFSIILFAESWYGVVGKSLIHSPLEGLISIGILGVAALACFFEAKKNGDYQVEELIAVFASAEDLSVTSQE
jgi:hypothetical protein